MAVEEVDGPRPRSLRGGLVVEEEVRVVEGVVGTLADLHRGETVLVLVPAALVDAGLGSGSGTVDAPFVTVVVDADGWSVRSGLPATS